jgi:glycosyltransferase involved in cell wall biosynthesis
MPDRIRVLWLIKGLGPGGAERLLTACATVRDRDAFDYRAAYLLPWKDRLVPDLERLDVGVECLAVRDERDVRWAARLRSLLLENPVDIVHAHSPYAAGIGRLVVRSLPRAPRPRLVSTEHNAWSTFAPATRSLNAVTSPLDDAVIAVSADVRDSIRGPARRRTEVVTHGVLLDRVREFGARREQTRQELGIGPDDVLVATVANYVPKKDYPNLLEAARLVGARTPSVRFVAVGQGPHEKEIHELRHRLRLDDRVLLTGYREDAVGVLAGADIFVLASRWEGLPVALMEAMALGLPVVATAVGGVPEAVGRGIEGLLVPPERPDLLADAIADLAGDAHRRKEMGEAARIRGDGFDITRAVRRIEAIYRDLVRR